MIFRCNICNLIYEDMDYLTYIHICPVCKNKNPDLVKQIEKCIKENKRGQNG